MADLRWMLPSVHGVIGLRQVDGMPHQAPSLRDAALVQLACNYPRRHTVNRCMFLHRRPQVAPFALVLGADFQTGAALPRLGTHVGPHVLPVDEQRPRRGPPRTHV